MESGLGARADRVLTSIINHLNNENGHMSIVIVHSGARGRLGVIHCYHLPNVGDFISLQEKKYEVVGRTFDFDKQEIRLLVNDR